MQKIPSLLIIGNSNVGKSSITRLLVKNPKLLKGKTGKAPGSTLLIKPIFQPDMPYQIIDLPGFGYMRQASKRREEHIKNKIVVHIEKHHGDYFLALLVINILRIEDEIQKYFIDNKKTIPLTFELINFLREFNIPLLVILNKIDKVSNYDKNKKISLFIQAAREYNIPLSEFKNLQILKMNSIPYLEFSALKKTNLHNLRKLIKHFLILNEQS
jgi:GTP-binding protein EngB required for normal cell division